jgi:nucleoid-associated protein YgaU
MGIFDKFKSVLGGSKPGPDDRVRSPTRVLRDAGVDTSCIDCKVGSDGSVTVSGTVASGDERDRIVSILQDMPHVAKVVNDINVGAAEPAPQPAAEPATENVPGAPAAGGGRTYTVKSGDTLWKIAQEMYGNGSRYMKIFEANTDKLENPDRIFPGQELVIPDLED